MMPEPNKQLFNRAHYNAIAKDIREEYKSYAFGTPNFAPFITAMRTLEELAVRFAKRFEVDNENFNPIQFLDACSPDPTLFPLSELWTTDG